jgi:hypothetical protein
MTESELAEEKRLAHEVVGTQDTGNEAKIGRPSSFITVFLAWLAVLLPLGWGIYKTLLSVSKFFS